MIAFLIISNIQKDTSNHETPQATGDWRRHVIKVSGHPSAKCLALAHRRVARDTPHEDKRGHLNPERHSSSSPSRNHITVRSSQRFDDLLYILLFVLIWRIYVLSVSLLLSVFFGTPESTLRATTITGKLDQSVYKEHCRSTNCNPPPLLV